MDGDVNDDNSHLRGFRQRWAQQARGSSPVDSSPQDSGLPSIVRDLSNLEVPNVDTQSELPESVHDDSHAVAQSGPTASFRDIEPAVTSAFASSVNWFPVKFPWETGVMAKILSDDPELQSNFSMHPSWNSSSVISPPLPATGSGEVPVSASLTIFAKHIKLTRNDSHWTQRERTLKSAVDKWSMILHSNLEGSAVGRQILSDPFEAHQIIVAVLGTKSPNTALKRVNSVMSFHRWASVNDIDQIIPFDERTCWRYVQFLNEAQLSASRASSFVQAVRFAHFVFSVDGALESSSSRRICGLADIQLAGKSEASKQARALTVSEVKRLHELAASSELHVFDRCIVSHLLLMLYGRCRASDTFHIESITHDTAPDSGYVEVTTRCHKGSKAAVTKTLLLPILIPVYGVSTPSWVESWWSARIEANLPVKGTIRGALQPAPSKATSRDWTARPLSSSELTDLLKAYLECPDDQLLSSHSLKATALSWSAKCEMPREYRRILGRHSSSVKDSDSVYSRELSYAPVRALERMFKLIRLSEFSPDAVRSKFFKHDLQPGAAPVFPPTPTFQAPGVAPVTPTPPMSAELSKPSVPQTDADMSSSRAEEIKSEPVQSEHASEADRSDEPCEVSSSSDEDSSGGESGLSSLEDCDDALEDPEPPRKVIKPVPGGESPPMDEVWLQHIHLKTVHVASNSIGSMCHVTQCGRKCSKLYTSVAVLNDWTLKCRVCFKGRRMPSG